MNIWQSMSNAANSEGGSAALVTAAVTATLSFFKWLDNRKGNRRDEQTDTINQKLDELKKHHRRFGRQLRLVQNDVNHLKDVVGQVPPQSPGATRFTPN